MNLRPIPARPALAAAALALCASLAAPVHAAGRADVSFVEPQRYSDAGFGVIERERTQRRLGEAFEALAAKLPEGQRLRVQVLDVDLAGEVEHFRLRDVRVMTGRADWPRLQLRWQLEGAGGAVLRQGQEHVSDLGYLVTSWPQMARDPLAHEKRMLGRWFDERVAGN
jgi:hypothetical protein